MKFIAALLFSFLGLTTITAQTITYDDFRSVIPFLQKEDYKSAFEKTEQLLHSTKSDSSNLRGIVTYMNLFSGAGMVSLDQMSYDDFSKVLNKCVGQYLVMSAHPYIDSSAHGYNSLQLATRDDGQLQGTTASTNDKRTSILFFEYFTYRDTINPGDFIGKYVRCGGILEAFELNPNKSNIWIARLHIRDAFATIERPR